MAGNSIKLTLSSTKIRTNRSFSLKSSDNDVITNIIQYIEQPIPVMDRWLENIVPAKIVDTVYGTA